jgi:peptidoglycan/xylan/chitin deacetylase (PgdA/CDA1 family)
VARGLRGAAPDFSRRQFLTHATAACVFGVVAPSLVRSAGDWHTESDFSRRLVDPRAVSSVRTDAKLVALTFDDGPDPAFTPGVLRILAEFGVSATFFCIGRNVDEHPELARDIVRAGHVIAQHTFNHCWLDGAPASEIERELAGGRRSLQDLDLASGGLFRPPRGWTSPTVASVTKAMGIRSVFWSDCLEHHLLSPPDDAAAQVVAASSPGSIVLCHDGGHLGGPNPQDVDRSQTVAALPALLDGLLTRGLRPVVLPELLAAGRQG